MTTSRNSKKTNKKKGQPTNRHVNVRRATNFKEQLAARRNNKSKTAPAETPIIPKAPVVQPLTEIEQKFADYAQLVEDEAVQKEIIVPVAPDTFDVNVSSADIVPETVLRTAYLGNANVGADVKSIPCSIICNEVALPISAPKGITVAPVTSKTEKEDSLTNLPPCSNSILLKSVVAVSVLFSNPINLVPSIVAVGKDV